MHWTAPSPTRARSPRVAELLRRARHVTLAARIAAVTTARALNPFRPVDTPADTLQAATVAHAYAGNAADALRALARAHGIAAATIDLEDIALVFEFHKFSDEERARIAAAMSDDPDGYHHAIRDADDLHVDYMHTLLDTAGVTVDEDQDEA
jgi:hypothetical protein